MQEPQALLRVGQWNQCGPRHRPQPGPCLLGPVDPVDQLRDGGRVEHRRHRQVHLEGGLDPADQPHREQRVPAQLEEALVHADLWQAQHLGEQPAQHLLALSPRRTTRLAAGGVGGGQRRVVELAVGGQRERVEHQDRRGHQVLGQRARQVLTQLPGFGAAAGHHVADEPPVTGPVLADDHRGLLDRGMRAQRRGDLPQFDAEPAHLDLVVHAVQVLQLAVRPPPHQVSGAVHATAVEGVGHEPLGGQRRSAQVTAGQAVARHVQLSGHAGRHRVQLAVEHVHPRARDRPADHLGAVRPGDVHGGLGGAVGVDQQPIPRPDRRQVLGAPLAAGDQHSQLGQLGGRDRGQHRGRYVHVGDPLLGQGRGQLGAEHGAGRYHEAAAVQQRQAQLRHGHVETGRDELQHPRLLVHPVGAGLVADQVGQAPVSDGNPLGQAGRPRGVDHVRQVVHGPARPEVPVLPTGRRGVDQQPGCAVLGQGGGPGGVGDHQFRPRVGQQVGDALSRVARVHGQVGGARLEHREDRDHEFDRTRQRHRHDPGTGQAARQQVRPRVELPVGQHAVRALHRRVARRTPHLLLEQLRQGLRFRTRPAVPPAQHPVLLRRAQHGNRRHRTVRVAQHLDQYLVVPGSQRLDRGRVEQVRGVLDRGAQLGPGHFLDHERQVELGHAGRDLLDPRVQARHGELAVLVVLHHEHDLEQRVPSGRAGRAQGLHQPLEGQVLVGEGRQVGVAHPGQQLAEAGPARQVRAQHEGVDEEAHQVADRVLGAPGHGGADGDVLARAHSHEQHAQRRLQHHEQRGVRLPREIGQRAAHGLVDEEVVLGTSVGGHGGADPVGGQFELVGQSGQRLDPVGQLASRLAARVLLVTEQFSLPQRVVRVLDRKFGQVCRGPAAACGVAGRQVADQRREGPAVAGDVMAQQEQHVLGGTVREQRRAQRQLGGQVEAVPDRLVQVTRTVHNGHFQQRSVRGQDVLVRNAVHVREHRAQRLVPPHDVPDRLLQRGAVQRPGQVQHERDVVGRARAFHAVQEPQALLCVGQRNPVRPGRGHQLGPDPTAVAQSW